MIHLADERLRTWVQSVVGDVEVALTPPGVPRTGPGVSLYLMEMVDAPPLRGDRRPPLQLGLRYLITTWGDEPEDAHRILGELVFAAMDHGEFEVDLAPLPAAAWAAFGVPPQPAFVLRVPLRQARPEPQTKLVRAPLVVRSVARSSLFGRVLGPNDVPLAGATVELPSLQLLQRTDARGRFRFAAVPDEPRARMLRIKANGSILSVRVERPTTEAEPLVIRFNPEHG